MNLRKSLFLLVLVIFAPDSIMAAEFEHCWGSFIPSYHDLGVPPTSRTSTSKEISPKVVLRHPNNSVALRSWQLEKITIVEHFDEDGNLVKTEEFSNADPEMPYFVQTQREGLISRSNIEQTEKGWRMSTVVMDFSKGIIRLTGKASYELRSDKPKSDWLLTGDYQVSTQKAAKILGIKVSNEGFSAESGTFIAGHKLPGEKWELVSKPRRELYQNASSLENMILAELNVGELLPWFYLENFLEEHPLAKKAIQKLKAETHFDVVNRRSTGLIKSLATRIRTEQKSILVDIQFNEKMQPVFIGLFQDRRLWAKIFLSPDSPYVVSKWIIIERGEKITGHTLEIEKNSEQSGKSIITKTEFEPSADWNYEDYKFPDFSETIIKNTVSKKTSIYSPGTGLEEVNETDR